MKEFKNDKDIERYIFINNLKSVFIVLLISFIIALMFIGVIDFSKLKREEVIEKTSETSDYYFGLHCNLEEVVSHKYGHYTDVILQDTNTGVLYYAYHYREQSQIIFPILNSDGTPKTIDQIKIPGSE